MDNILLFFVLPISTIILAVVLQKVLKSPTLVAATFFAIYLIVTYTAFNQDFLIYAIAYSIIAYLAAVLTNQITRLLSLANNNEREGQKCCNCRRR